MIFHATLAIFLATLSIFSAALLIQALACALFVAALWECFLLIWTLRPVRYRAWCCVFASQRGKFTVSWMAV